MKSRLTIWRSWITCLFLPIICHACAHALPPAHSYEKHGHLTKKIPGIYNPVADPRAEVRFRHARFTVLTSRLIRMEWAANDSFEDHASFVFLNRNLPVPPFTHFVRSTSSGQILTIQTKNLTVTYAVANDESGQFNAKDLQIDLTVQGKRIVWHPGTSNTGNLRGTARTLDDARGAIPVGQGLISRDGWALIDDSTRPLFDSADFSFRQGESSVWPWAIERTAGAQQDWYFFGYGHHYKQALGDYIQVAGRIPMPPYFAFGTWWSRYWAYSDQELKDLVNGFQENDTPLDVLVVDMDWHPIFRQPWGTVRKKDASGHGLGWTGYSWNYLLFPDPEQFLQHMHRQGLKVTLNVHPASGIQPWETRYPQMARAMGIDPATRQYVPFDITSKKFAANYMDIMHHPLERQGIDFWWLDWQQESTTKLPGVNPTWWLNYVFFTDQAREGKRPLIFHRWGGLGNHRYQIGFSGDTISAWSSLSFQPWFTATAANVGYAYWSHDIGGHMPGAVTPELYARWVQFGVFSPILRTHTTKNPEAERRIWAYPEPYANIMRAAFHLRYRMIPYIYTEARRTYDTGVAFVRPLYYDWPNDNNAYTARNEYMFGGEMICAPVTTPVDKDSQLAAETIWLPKGEWIESPTGKSFTGPLRATRQFSMNQIPVYVRDGAIVPMAPPMLHTGQKPVDPLILTIYPQRQGSSSRYTLYQDAGNTRAYQGGQAAWTKIKATQDAESLLVQVEPERGSYPGMPTTRAYQLRLPDDWPPDSVTLNGMPISYNPRSNHAGWRFAGNTLTTVITLPSIPTTSGFAVRVHRTEYRVAHREELDGFAGKMERLREAYDTLNQTFPLGWSPDSLIDAMQTGDRLSYSPKSIDREVEQLQTIMPKAVEDVELMKTSISPEAQAKVEKSNIEAWKKYQNSIDSVQLEQCLRRLMNRNVDGIAVMTSEVEVQAFERVKRSKVPLVLLNQATLGRRFNNIEVDYSKGFDEAVRHLKNLGHRRIAFISGPSNFGSVGRRRTAFLAGIKHSGLKVREELIFEGDLHAEGGHAAMQKLLDASLRATAIICSNDLMAVGALQACHAVGVRVPEEISIIGFDDLPIAAMVSPPLTTITLSRQEIAERAFSVLWRASNPKLKTRLARHIISPSLTVRASTGAPV